MTHHVIPPEHGSSGLREYPHTDYLTEETRPLDSTLERSQSASHLCVTIDQVDT